jgi:hypothetical protein
MKRPFLAGCLFLAVLAAGCARQQDKPPGPATLPKPGPATLRKPDPETLWKPDPATLRKVLGGWRGGVGEDRLSVSFGPDGNFVLRHYHDGAGGEKGFVTKGTYRLLDDKTIEVRQDDGRVLRGTIDASGATIELWGQLRR